MAKLKVAMIAPPWLKIPPEGYGGIEIVVDTLVHGLVGQGVEVELFTIQKTKRLKHVKVHALYQSEQYEYMHRPMYEAAPIIAAHMQFAINRIREIGDFDVIHDHNGFIGPQLLASETANGMLPPAVHTLHGPPFSSGLMTGGDLPSNKPYWQELSKNMGRVYLIGISSVLTAPAPKSLKKHILSPVHNAVDLSQFPYVAHKKNYFITLARFNKDKGHHLAAKLCIKLGQNLRMAGPVADITTGRQLSLELANPHSPYRSASDFRYYSDLILPLTLHSQKVKYVGSLSGRKKMKFISQAKALLFPIDWEEPFGMAVIEALACGTPVVAMNRGAMPEIIEHGVNGFLANNEKEFEEYMLKVEEIDPHECRRSVEEKFSAEAMSQKYVDRYREVIELSRKQK